MLFLCVKKEQEYFEKAICFEVLYPNQIIIDYKCNFPTEPQIAKSVYKNVKFNYTSNIIIF